MLEKKKKEQKLIIILVVIVIIAVLILYFGLWKKEVSEAPIVGTELPGSAEALGGSPQSAAGVVLEEKLKKIDLNTDFLVKIILPFLKVQGAIPVLKGITGKPNPFVAK